MRFLKKLRSQVQGFHPNGYIVRVLPSRNANDAYYVGLFDSEEAAEEYVEQFHFVSDSTEIIELKAPLSLTDDRVA